LEGFAVQRLYCGLSAFLAVHRYEGESTRAARFPVVDNLGLHHDAVRRKEFHEVCIRHVEGQVADKQSCFHSGLEYSGVRQQNPGRDAHGIKPLSPQRPQRRISSRYHASPVL